MAREARVMRISWYFGFGWLSIVTLVVCAVGISRLGGTIAWVLYVPFLIVALYMTVRFRLYNTEPWRRVHGRAMIAYGKLAAKEYDAANQGGRPFDIKVPCRGLAEQLFGQTPAGELDALLADGRTQYYRGLVEAYPQVFLNGVGEDRRKAVLDGVRRDVDASELGPDILIARAIERKHGGREAANYLRALLLGRVR
jgi:hypothetical protein